MMASVVDSSSNGTTNGVHKTKGQSSCPTNGSHGKSQFTNLLRPDLKSYCPASNLAFNEKVSYEPEK